MALVGFFLEARSKLISSTCHILWLISLVGWVHSDSKIHDLPQEATITLKLGDQINLITLNLGDGMNLATPKVE